MPSSPPLFLAQNRATFQSRPPRRYPVSRPGPSAAGRSSYPERYAGAQRRQSLNPRRRRTRETPTTVESYCTPAELHPSSPPELPPVPSHQGVCSRVCRLLSAPESPPELPPHAQFLLLYRLARKGGILSKHQIAILAPPPTEIHRIRPKNHLVGREAAP